MHYILLRLIIVVLVISAVTGCRQASIPLTATATTPIRTHIAPTLTPAPTNTLPPTATPIGGGSGRVTFVSTADETSNINIVNADGTDLNQLFSIKGPAHSATWSPDGKKIGYLVSKLDKSHSAVLYVMNADGSGATRLSDESSGVYEYIWSPDSKMIAYSSGPNYMLTQIYLIGVDKKNLQQITNKAGLNFFGNWTPDGEKIVINSQRNDESGIYVINIADSKEIRLGNPAAELYSPSWSHDGQHIAFVAIADKMELHTIRPDGTGETTISSWSFQGRFTFSVGGWSPDDKKLIVECGLVGNPSAQYQTDIYVVEADGSGQKQLTQDLGQNSGSSWSPDGKLILFLSTLDNSSRVYVMNADGSGQIRLDNLSPNANSPSWEP